MPFVIDPTGLFAAEVNADYTLGERIGLTQTPTIFVVTQKNWVQVTDSTCSTDHRHHAGPGRQQHHCLHCKAASRRSSEAVNGRFFLVWWLGVFAGVFAKTASQMW